MTSEQKDQLIAELLEDRERLEWIFAQGGTYAQGVLSDMPGDGLYCVWDSRDKSATGKTMRAAIDAARGKDNV